MGRDAARVTRSDHDGGQWRVGHSLLDSARALTDSGDDEYDDVGVHHGGNRVGKGRHHLPERLDLAEEPDDADGTEGYDDAHRQVDGSEADEGEGNHHQVQQVPPVAEEGLEPLSIQTQDELDGEDYGEEQVQRILSCGEGTSGRRMVCDAAVGHYEDLSFLKFGAYDTDDKALSQKPRL